MLKIFKKGFKRIKKEFLRIQSDLSLSSNLVGYVTEDEVKELEDWLNNKIKEKEDDNKLIK